MHTAFEVVLDWADVTATSVFECPSYPAAGTIFAVLVTDGVALTGLSGDHGERVARACEPVAFRAGDRTSMKWLHVTIDDGAAIDSLVPHIGAGYESARTESD